MLNNKSCSQAPLLCAPFTAALFPAPYFLKNRRVFLSRYSSISPQTVAGRKLLNSVLNFARGVWLFNHAWGCAAACYASVPVPFVMFSPSADSFLLQTAKQPRVTIQWLFTGWVCLLLGLSHHDMSRGCHLVGSIRPVWMLDTEG